jgi:hypothetical protein
MGVLAALPAPALVFALCWVNTACLIGALRTVAGADAVRRGVATLAGGFFALAYGTLTTTDAHPTHAVIALLWFLAVRAAIRDRPAVAGLLLGVACGLDTWAVLGARRRAGTAPSPAPVSMLLPPVAGQFGGILVTYGPPALCLAVVVCAPRAVDHRGAAYRVGGSPTAAVKSRTRCDWSA